jgi:hypothetical protein
MRFREKLEIEFHSRRAKNSRYSLRAFAAFLETDHSTLSQVLKRTRPIPLRHIRSWAHKLGLTRDEAALFIAAEHVLDAPVAAREAQLRNWTAEALGVLTEPAHFEILRLCRAPGFRPDCRWIAGQSGIPVDEVNIALSRLMRLGLLHARAAGEWRDVTGLPVLTTRNFRELALARVKERALA